MATNAFRKARGYRSQRVVAEFFQRHGWPFAESTGAGRSGSDVTGMPGLACEVKARSDLQPLAWLKQAEMNAGLPFVVFRPNGMGEESVGRWGVLLRLEVLTELLRGAGYGDPLPADAGDDPAYQQDKKVEHERSPGDGADPTDRPGVGPAFAHDRKAT